MHEQRSPEGSEEPARLDGAILGPLASRRSKQRLIARGGPGRLPFHPSEEFGRTPPPANGSLVACPKCFDGRKRIDPYRVPCPDCLGSGVQGYGFTALTIFEDWVSNLPSACDGEGKTEQS